MWKAQILSHEIVLQRGTGDRQCIQEADQVQGEKEKEHIRYNLIIPTLYCVFIIYANENAGNLISVVQFLRNKYIYNSHFGQE